MRLCLERMHWFVLLRSLCLVFVKVTTGLLIRASLHSKFHDLWFQSFCPGWRLGGHMSRIRIAHLVFNTSLWNLCMPFVSADLQPRTTCKPVSAQQEAEITRWGRNLEDSDFKSKAATVKQLALSVLLARFNYALNCCLVSGTRMTSEQSRPRGAWIHFESLPGHVLNCASKKVATLHPHCWERYSTMLKYHICT